jgi:precorrin-6x reductase
VLKALPDADVRIGRLDGGQMKTLLTQTGPALVVDATHPYAEEASRNISAACQNSGIPLLRVLRKGAEDRDCFIFGNTTDLLAWLKGEPGNIFVTTGSSHAALFRELPDFQNRVWLRVLPSLDSLRVCLELGYPPERLIGMQGPFNEELNRAMFRAANARILVTKNSGAAGGFPEKARAAQSLGMLTAVLAKPEEPDGITLAEAIARIRGLTG